MKNNKDFSVIYVFFAKRPFFFAFLRLPLKSESHCVSLQDKEVKTMKKIRNIFSKKNLKTIAKLPVLLGAIIVVEKVLEKCYELVE